MRRIGILGGMSWESSIEYERLINEAVRSELGGTASGDLIIRSYDFAEIEALQEEGAWEQLGQMLAADAAVLEAAGAECIVIATNTMHKVAPEIERRIRIPLLHIADTTAEAIEESGIAAVALLGTLYTMEQDFYRARIEDHGLSVIVPDEPSRTMVHDVIYNELVRGIVSDVSRKRFLRLIGDLVSNGAEGVIAGCTEIELLVTPDDVTVPYFPTTRLHAEAAVRFALSCAHPDSGLDSARQ